MKRRSIAVASLAAAGIAVVTTLALTTVQEEELDPEKIPWLVAEVQAQPASYDAHTRLHTALAAQRGLFIFPQEYRDVLQNLPEPRRSLYLMLTGSRVYGSTDFRAARDSFVAAVTAPEAGPRAEHIDLTEQELHVGLEEAIESYLPADMETMRSLTDLLLRRFPESTAGYKWRAKMYLYMDNTDGAAFFQRTGRPLWTLDERPNRWKAMDAVGEILVREPDNDWAHTQAYIALYLIDQDAWTAFYERLRERNPKIQRPTNPSGE